MADPENKPENTPPSADDQKKTIKGLIKESLTEWADEQRKTRTDSGPKPKGLLESLLGY